MNPNKLVWFSGSDMVYDGCISYCYVPIQFSLTHQVRFVLVEDNGRFTAIVTINRLKIGMVAESDKSIPHLKEVCQQWWFDKIKEVSKTVRNPWHL